MSGIYEVFQTVHLIPNQECHLTFRGWSFGFNPYISSSLSENQWSEIVLRNPQPQDAALKVQIDECLMS